jgi:spermidine synthase
MSQRLSLPVGLLLTTLATLLLEILNSRLLSVLTWYHLSFVAVSLAMLGLAAGAVRVFLGGRQFEGEEAIRRLPALTLAFTGTMVASHLVSLCIPLATTGPSAPVAFVALATVIAVLTVPFFYSGVVVTIALTRGQGPMGRLYAFDLVGAALGCLFVVILLDSGFFNLSSVVFLAAGTAAAGGYCFSLASRAPSRASLVIAGLLIAAALINGSRMNGIEVAYAKSPDAWMGADVQSTRWNSHSYVLVKGASRKPPFLWGGGLLRRSEPINSAFLIIDGLAGSPITEWDGRESLDWVAHDVTTLPYYLRRGSAAVIGVGGGRDVLSAIWGGNAPILGIEINATILNLLTGPHRRFASIADRPEVRLVHDDARAYLTRAPERFDILQMSLIDTWAATGAGAFTLSENGLYTTEAWAIFLSRLTPDGVFSVSRWFSPVNVSETTRLVALATASLVEKGVKQPGAHLLLMSSGNVATLVVSASPLTDADRGVVERLAASEGFNVRLAPWSADDGDRLSRVARSQSRVEIERAIGDPELDFSPPSDDRPFFFNMLKPTSFWRGREYSEGVLSGNIAATETYLALFVIASLMVGAIIVYPLLARGRPAMPANAFVAALAYFASIGFGFMLVQVALLQRFSLYLGHPTYTLSVTLFAMILFAGLGSVLSDRLSLTRDVHRVLPIAAAVTIVLLALIVGRVTDATIHLGLAARTAIVVGLLMPLATLLGFFFPVGLRLVAALSPAATPWMWGINGACGVLGSIVAVGISMWAGIRINLMVAAALYGSLLLSLGVLQAAQVGRRAATTPAPAETER